MTVPRQIKSGSASTSTSHCPDQDRNGSAASTADGPSRRASKSTTEKPGTGVRKKSRINRSLLDASMSELLRQIRYKAEWYGRTVLEVPEDYPSSQTCSACGHIEIGLRLDEYRWTCPHCGEEHDRDDNAAVNIEAEGLRMLNKHPEDTGEVRASGGKANGARRPPEPNRVSANRPGA